MFKLLCLYLEMYCSHSVEWARIEDLDSKPFKVDTAEGAHPFSYAFEEDVTFYLPWR